MCLHDVFASLFPTGMNHGTEFTKIEASNVRLRSKVPRIKLLSSDVCEFVCSRGASENVVR